MGCWWRDIVRERSFEGQHTKIVQHGLRIIIYHFRNYVFFCVFFHSSLSPAPTIGGVWLPIEIEILNPWEIAFLNNFIFIL